MKVPTRKTVTSWLLNIALLLGIYILIQAYQSRDAPQSGPAPEIQSIDIDGQYIDLNNYQGKPVLIYFWASWCTVCSLTRGSVESISKDYSVITIASQSGTDKEIHAYQQEHQFDVTIINDAQGPISQAYGVQAFPSVFILDSAGNVSDVEIGLSSETGLRLRLWWANW